MKPADEKKVREAVGKIIETVEPLEWEQRAQVLAAAAIVSGCYDAAQTILDHLKARKAA